MKRPRHFFDSPVPPIPRGARRIHFDEQTGRPHEITDRINETEQIVPSRVGILELLLGGHQLIKEK